ncbi:hypothetical protein GA0070216_101625 [Micromonospora matsumotoense]|uniref:Uncharacterized protein n=1 Tax=Micromonospora matsumotoense TaxID=121616 RepID=A0A1C4UN33_9ACTN|nr:hypothetical protein [Micromonospora matsumotoense]SCE73077.1 hypothetical protein GA0070216_101625 [Micromonospora matsumotoense]
MPGDDLTPSEAAILFVLMAEAREVPNAELRKRYGVDVRKSYRDKLNRLGFVDSRREGNTFLHQLADKGWVRVQEDLNFQSSQGRILGGALTALQVNLRDRVMGRSDYRTFGEMFALTDVRAGTAQPGQQRTLDLRIRQAYAALAAEPGAWVSLTRLRPFFGDVDTADLDEALRELEREPDVDIVPESNQKVLTPADVAAALRLGGQDKHLLAIGVG